MRIVNMPVYFFHGRWWTTAEENLFKSLPMFFPETKQFFTLEELRAILIEMEKMNAV